MNFEVFDSDYLKFHHPFTCLVVGPTKSGKTQFMYRFLLNIHKLIEPPPEEIYFVYSEWQQAYQQMVLTIPKIQMIEGMIELSKLKKDVSLPKLLILDDMMSEMAKNDALNKIFTRGAHHWSTSVIFIVQNLFFSGIRNARLNSHYLLLFKSPDKQQLNCLARQLYPGKGKFLLDAYRNATNQKYNPLLIDLTTDIDDRFRLRSNFLPGEVTTIYRPKSL